MFRSIINITKQSFIARLELFLVTKIYIYPAVKICRQISFPFIIYFSYKWYKLFLFNIFIYFWRNNKGFCSNTSLSFIRTLSIFLIDNNKNFIYFFRCNHSFHKDVLIMALFQFPLIKLNFYAILH